MVEIEFSLTPEDLAEANQQIQPYLNKVRLVFVSFLFILIFPLIFTLPAFRNILVVGIWLILFPTVLIFFVIFLFVFRSFNNPANILRGYKGWEDTIFDIPLTMRILPDQLFVTSRIGESKIKSSYFRKAHFSANLVILYFGPITHYVIPRRGVTRGDYDAFVAELQKHIHPTLD